MNKFRNFLKEDSEGDKEVQKMWDKAYHDINKDWDEPSQKQHKINESEDVPSEDLKVIRGLLETHGLKKVLKAVAITAEVDKKDDGAEDVIKAIRKFVIF